MKHYTLTKVGKEWCLRARSNGRAVAWAPAIEGKRTPPPEMKAYADEAERAAAEDG